MHGMTKLVGSRGRGTTEGRWRHGNMHLSCAPKKPYILLPWPASDAHRLDNNVRSLETQVKPFSQTAGSSLHTPILENS